MAIFKGAKNRDDTFVGGGRPDTFLFGPADLTSGDTVVGGGGRRGDTLRFTTSGAIGASALAGVSGIEQIVLADGTNSIVVNDALVASAIAARMKIVGGSGDDLVYAAGLTGQNAVDIVAGGGADLLLGGAGADGFAFDTVDLDAHDVVAGGAGSDRLLLSGTGSLAADQLSGVTGIEAVVLGDGGVSIIVPETIARTASDRSLAILGGDGVDVIDSRLIVGSDQLETLSISGGGGDDVIAAGTAQHCVIDGGAGADTIDASFASILYDAADIHQFVLSGTLRVSTGGVFDLTDVDDQSAGDNCIVRGFTAIDASASRTAVNLTALWGESLIGGSGDDVLTGGAHLTGGKGADRLVGSDEGPTTFTIGAGDFAAGETLIGRSFSDAIALSGSVDFRRGTLDGYFDLLVNSAGSDLTHISLTAAQADMIRNDYFFAQDAEDRFIVDIYLGRDDPATFSTGIDYAVVHGRRGGDTIDAGYGSAIGEGGNDVLTGGGTLSGGDGDDRLFGATFGFYNALGGAGDDVVTADFFFPGSDCDGGAGNDTFVATGWSPGAATDFDLSSGGNQSGRIDMMMRHFENIDLSGVQDNSYTFTIRGSAGDNVLVGGAGGNTLSGLAGDDTLAVSFGDGRNILDGGAGDDIIKTRIEFSVNTLTGGRGADTFVFDGRPEETNFQASNSITDFTPGVDRLEFDRSAFNIAGRNFDTLIVTNDTATNITGADLVIYRGPLDIETYLNQAAGGRDDDGIFIVGRNDDGDAILYHSTASSYGSFDYNLIAVANLGDIGQLTNLTLNDFSFI